MEPKPIALTATPVETWTGNDPQPFVVVGPVNVDSLYFYTTYTESTHAEGTLHWDDGLHTLEIDMGTSRQSVGFEQYMPVRNNSGATILNGTAVMITGQIGNRSTISPDDGTGKVAGVTTYDLPNNTFGRVTTFGYVNDLDTSGFTAGDIVFSNVSGGITTDTSASFVGFIGNVHPTQGSLLVRTHSFLNPTGPTAQRPMIPSEGIMYIDTTLGKPVWYINGQWRDATGTVV